MRKIMYMCGRWLVSVCMGGYFDGKAVIRLLIYTYTTYNLYSPWRGCGSWPVLRRSPPRWLSGGQRQNSCRCSRRVFACSCASWTVFHTAPGNACRSREEIRVKGKTGAKCVSYKMHISFFKCCNQRYNDTWQTHPSIKTKEKQWSNMWNNHS